MDNELLENIISNYLIQFQNINEALLSSNYQIDIEKTKEIFTQVYIQALKNNNYDEFDNNCKQVIKLLKIQFAKYKFLYRKSVLNNLAFNKFINKIWYTDIATADINKLHKDLEIIKDTDTLVKMNLDLEDLINAAVRKVALLWTSKALGVFDNNIKQLRSNIRKIYERGIEKDGDACKERIFAFLKQVTNVEQIINKYGATNLNLMYPATYTELMDNVKAGLRDYNFINASAITQLLDKLKLEIQNNDLNTNNIIKSLTDETIKLYNDNSLYIRFGNDFLTDLNELIRQRKITSAKAETIVNILVTISNTMTKLLMNMTNVKKEIQDKVNIFDENIYARAKELALNQVFLSDDIPYLRNISSLQELRNELNDSNSTLRKKREELLDNAFNNVKAKLYNFSMDNSPLLEIKNVISSNDLDNFYHMANNTIYNAFTYINNLIIKYNKYIKDNKKQLQPKKFPILGARKIINALINLKENSPTIAENVETYKELYGENANISNYIVSYRTFSKKFITELNDKSLSAADLIKKVNDVNYKYHPQYIYNKISEWITNANKEYKNGTADISEDTKTTSKATEYSQSEIYHDNITNKSIEIMLWKNFNDGLSNKELFNTLRVIGLLVDNPNQLQDDKTARQIWTEIVNSLTSEDWENESDPIYKCKAQHKTLVYYHNRYSDLIYKINQIKETNIQKKVLQQFKEQYGITDRAIKAIEPYRKEQYMDKYNRVQILCIAYDKLSSELIWAYDNPESVNISELLHKVQDTVANIAIELSSAGVPNYAKYNLENTGYTSNESKYALCRGLVAVYPPKSFLDELENMRKRPDKDLDVKDIIYFLSNLMLAKVQEWNTDKYITDAYGAIKKSIMNSRLTKRELALQEEQTNKTDEDNDARNTWEFKQVHKQQ